MGETKILVCRTCPRYASNASPEKANSVKANGTALWQEIRALLPPEDQNNLRVVNCLAGCRNPCNVALTEEGKPRLRFSRLGPGDGAAVIETARTYGESLDGNLATDQLPTALRDRLSAKSPAKVGAIGGIGE